MATMMTISTDGSIKTSFITPLPNIKIEPISVKENNLPPSYWLSNDHLVSIRKVANAVGVAVATYISPIATALGAGTKLYFSEEKHNNVYGPISEKLFRRVTKVVIVGSLLTTYALAIIAPVETGVLYTLSFIKGFFGMESLIGHTYNTKVLLIDPSPCQVDEKKPEETATSPNKPA